MTKEMKKKLQTTQRRMVRIVIQTKRQTGKCAAAAHAAGVEDTADVETHDPDSEQGDDTTQHNNQDLNEHEGSSHDADSDPCIDEIPEDNPDDDLEPWVDYMLTATRKADAMLAASGITSWILRQSLIYGRQATMIAKDHEDRWTTVVSNWKPAMSTQQKGTGNSENRAREPGTRREGARLRLRILPASAHAGEKTWNCTSPLWI